MKKLILLLVLFIPVLAQAQLLGIKTGDSLDVLNDTIASLHKNWGVIEHTSYTKDYKGQKTLIRLPYFAEKGGYRLSSCNFILYNHKVEKIMMIFDERASYPDLLMSLKYKYGEPKTQTENGALWVLPKKDENIYLIKQAGIISLQYENRKLLSEEYAKKSNNL